MREQKPRPIRVALVEDDGWVRESMQKLLAATAGAFEVVGSFGGRDKATEALSGGLGVDVVVVDLGLPDGSGIDVIEATRRFAPDSVAVAFTVFEDAPHVFRALRAGARGYLLKTSSPDAFVAGMREALAGGAPMTPSIARLVVGSFEKPVAEASPDGADYQLTSREKDVLILLSKGLSYPSIAQALGVGVGTIQGYVKQIYRKLEVASKAEAASIATRMGLV